ncbi:nif11-like leader peptide domain protein [Synechococcus sp. BIOS-E4-1]|uniref:Nif11-like leader peptide family natural product precursor n=1 Tax=Synechococcus sp. BIOS-E4-1 TaxID=1400864 RepID=UPI00185F533E|nr:nif11-like leader peptide domain protein [Synechococcus sp. BIOS-E4-1]
MTFCWSWLSLLCLPITHIRKATQLIRERVQSDTILQKKIKAAAVIDVVDAIAKEAGFIISADELKKAQLELSDEELESVARANITELGHTKTPPS